MNNCDLQMVATTLYVDQAIAAAEKENIEMFASVVPGSRLHEIINTVNSGIDEG